jgi:hypothetical protein
MFIADLFETKIQKTLVICPGGYHPFHPGHLSLYQSAQQAFPGADIYYASSNDKSERPFDFSDKAKLAKIAGVPSGHFVQVKSPFQAKEIVAHYDPNTTALVFVRSEKDRNEPPQAGGVKKDGSASYLQPITKNLQPLSRHSYMAYLPTVEFTGGITSASEIRSQWPRANAMQRKAWAKELYPNNPVAAQQILDKYLSPDWGSLGEELSVEDKIAIFELYHAKDPRYSTSLTQDVRPGQIDKNLKAFNLESRDEPYQKGIDRLQNSIVTGFKADRDYYQDLANHAKDPATRAGYLRQVEKYKEKIRSTLGL